MCRHPSGYVIFESFIYDKADYGVSSNDRNSRSTLKIKGKVLKLFPI